MMLKAVLLQDVAAFGSADRSEGRTDLPCEQFRLLPGRVVPAPRGQAVVIEGRIGDLGPAAWRLEDLARESAERDRDGDRWRGSAHAGGLGPLPVRPGGRLAGAGQPVERGVV